MVLHTSKMIQIRNVPDELHREVKARAARAGMSLSDYLLREVRRSVATPPVEQVLARIAGRERPRLEETPAEAVRAERDAQEALRTERATQEVMRAEREAQEAVRTEPGAQEAGRAERSAR